MKQRNIKDNLNNHFMYHPPFVDSSHPVVEPLINILLCSSLLTTGVIILSYMRAASLLPPSKNVVHWVVPHNSATRYFLLVLRRLN